MLHYIGAGAFDDWEYDVMYSPVGSDGSPLEVTTTSLNMTLINLMSGTIYELDIIARGLGGVQSLTETLLFTTKAAGMRSHVCDVIVMSSYLGSVHELHKVLHLSIFVRAGPK